MRLIDTSVLVEAFDNSSQKTGRAQDVLSYYMGTGEAVICLQTVAELYAALTKKLSPHEAMGIAERVLESSNYKKIHSDRAALSDALALSGKNKLRRSEVFDALLAATAKRNGVGTILTENPKHFSMFGLTVETLETATLSKDF